MTDRIREQIEWMDALVRRWHESAAPPSEVAKAIETKQALTALLEVYEAAMDAYNNFPDPDRSDVGQELGAAIAKVEAL